MADVVKALYLIALIRLGLYGIGTAQGRIDRGKALLTVQYQKIRLNIEHRHAFNHAILKTNILVAVFQEHRSSNREILRNACYKPTDAAIVPYPTALEIRQLDFPFADILY